MHPSPHTALLDAARLAAGDQQYPPGALYVVATPIGNLADLSLRAVHVLGLTDAVACEDTRVSARLLQHLGLHKPLLAVHAHNEREAAAGVLQRLQRGERVALVSDAGTPAVSDPGARLVQSVRAAGLRCIPLPGASSVLAALSVAGDAHASGFDFIGFLPAKGEARQQGLQTLCTQARTHARTQVLLEAPHRVRQLADELAACAPQHTLTMARELTKQFEQVLSFPAGEAPARVAALDAQGGLRGEFVWLVHAAEPTGADRTGEDTALSPGAERLLAALLPALPLKQAVALVAAHAQAPRNAVYARALALRQHAASATPDTDGGTETSA